jgi:hypothetical protein
MANDDRAIDPDRTVEMRVGAMPPGKNPSGNNTSGTTTPVETPPAPTPGPGISPAGSNTVGRPQIKPVFPDATSLESPIPPGALGRRPSPTLDPIARARVSRTAKWVMLAGILLLVAWLPAIIGKAARVGGADAGAVNIAAIMAATIYGTVIATGLPRLLIPNLFGKWHEPVEALRDWIIVGVSTGILYVAFIFGIKTISKNPAETFAEWMIWRMPLLLVASVISLFVGRALAIRRESVLSSEVGKGFLQIAIPAVFLVVLERVLEKGFGQLAEEQFKFLVPLLGGGAGLCAAVALGIITWAATADASLSQVRRKRGAGAISDGTGPVDITLTVIGGRESGKTVLLAAAFYEWSTQQIGDLRIAPAEEVRAEETIQLNGSNGAAPATSKGGAANLEDIARELYVNNQFPVGTVSTQNLPFELYINDDKIARFTFLDYPGGAIAGRVANKQIVEEFWDRVADTDGLVMIADMSYVRRAQKDADWIQVRQAYLEVMQRLVERNGKRRVVPVALVLTKCDEFVDPNTGQIDLAALREGLMNFQYDDLEHQWRELNAKSGPGFVEFSTWITSAITYSVPQMDRNGLPDFTKPFIIAPPPPPITPSGCAAPLLWICAKVLRWNVTVFYDISTFLFGSSPKVRRRVDAVLEMERIAEERAGKAA